MCQKKDTTILNAVFKTKVHEDYVTDGKKHICIFPILRSFLLFKSDFHREPYLHCMRDFKLRRSLSQLHLSSHKLAFEKCRHCRPQNCCGKSFMCLL